jgi:DtxR family Mn-dependent transcriptional regulator
MADHAVAVELTSALEDYLETIYELVRDHRVARIKDIAKARGVRPASVTPAMRRLSSMGLIDYERREYITLTAQGEKHARRVYARHQLLIRFLSGILRIPKATALADACAIEHSISNETMDGLTRFVEFISACPEGGSLLERFHRCSLVHLDPAANPCVCSEVKRLHHNISTRTCADMQAGESAEVVQVTGPSEGRQRLLNMGVLPNVLLTLESVDHDRARFVVRLQGFRLEFDQTQAQSVVVS